MNCGRAVPNNPNNQHLPQPLSSNLSMAEPLCPNCRQLDAIQKLFGVISSGSSISLEISSTIGTGLFGSGSVAGTQIGGTVSSAYTRKETASVTNLVRILLEATNLGARSAAAMGQMSSSPESIKSKEHVLWDAELSFRTSLFMRHWQDIYYCQRCVGIFRLDEARFAPLGNMTSVLYKPPADDDYGVCEIEAGGYPLGFLGTRMDLYYIAMLFDDQGFHVAKEIKWQDRYRDHGEPNRSCTTCASLHQQFMRQMESERWIKLNEPTEKWYQVRLRR